MLLAGLYANIIGPRKPPAAGNGGYPVVVWIHGGSYQTGSPQNATGLVELAAGFCGKSGISVGQSVGPELPQIGNRSRV